MRKFSTIDGGGMLIAAALSVALLVGVIEPTRLHNRRLVAAMQASARERQRLAGINTQVRNLKLQIGAMSAQINSSHVKILPPEALNRRLTDVARLAAASGLTVNELKPHGSERKETFVMVPLRLSGHGTYPSCTRFLHCLHEQLGDFSVSAFRLNGSPDQSDSSANFVFDLRWISRATPVGGAVAELR